MNTSRWLWLYRPTAPSVRAQSVQVLCMAHAVAATGRKVTLCVEGAARPEAVLDFYGLEPVRTLRLHVLRGGRTAASLAFRARVAAWVLGGGGIAYARSKRYARELLRWPGRARLVLEAHEVDSLQAAERGQDPTALLALETEVLAGAAAVVANAPGTLALLRQAHALPPAIALHNGTGVRREAAGEGRGVGYVGSLRDYKDLRTLAGAAARLDLPVTVVGAEPSDPLAAELRALSGGRLALEPPVPPREVGAALRRFRVLVLPLSPGLFGAQLSSPLKLWDYLASGVPVVAADLLSVHAAAPGAFLPYPPGDAEGLAAAIRRAATDEALRARLVAAAPVRTWGDRAAELVAFLESVP